MLAPRLDPDPWLGEMLGRRSFRLAFPHPAPAAQPPSEGEAARQGCGKVFIHAKTEVHSPGESRYLERKGFFLVDTNVTFERPREASPAVDARIRPARPGDENAVVALAREAFGHSRFHLDPDIPRECADRIKGEWVRNYFLRKRGAAMAVSEEDGEITGFLLFLMSPETLVIDLVAVKPGHRGKGLAAAMLRHGESMFPSAAKVRVGTQVGNTVAINCYTRMGFGLRQAQYVFHYHGEMPVFERE